MKCFYHNDMDGKCAGAIVHRFYSGVYPFPETVKPEYVSINPKYIPIDYKDDFPFDAIKEGELIIVVDFSLQKPGDFQKLLMITKNIIWIDHHKTAIERHGDMPIDGLRVDGVAGCVLTWQYFFPETSIPRVVELLGDYDIWAFKYGEDTNKLQTGIKLYDTRPEDNNWLTWLNADYTADDLIKDGEIALLYRNNYYRDLVNSHGFFAEFEGHKVIACNAGLVSSQLFDSVKEDYDLMMPFCFDGKQWTVSIYTKKDIDCSALAEKHGGGGHKQAAGFQCEELPF